MIFVWFLKVFSAVDSGFVSKQVAFWGLQASCGLVCFEGLSGRVFMTL